MLTIDKGQLRLVGVFFFFVLDINKVRFWPDDGAGRKVRSLITVKGNMKRVSVDLPLGLCHRYYKLPQRHSSPTCRDRQQACVPSPPWINTDLRKEMERRGARTKPAGTRRWSTARAQSQADGWNGGSRLWLSQVYLEEKTQQGVNKWSQSKHNESQDICWTSHEVL